jgi:hypothetical protein
MGTVSPSSLSAAGRAFTLTRKVHRGYLISMVFRVIRTGAIWLTAIMTLFAGTPHFVCSCPNGRIKPFCLTFSSGKTGCCDGVCCSASQEGEEKGPAAHASLPAAGINKNCCCCKGHQENAKDQPRTDAQLGNERCRRTFVEGIVAIPAPSVETPVKDLTAHLFVLAPETTKAQEGFGACDCSFANHCHWPPPTDLVTLLQHFLI